MSVDDYRRELAKVRVSVRSANGWIRITRDPSGEIAVDIVPGELGRHTERAVADEIASALSNAYSDYQRQYQEIRRRHFGPSMGLLPLPTGGSSS
jgi:hypothetical protein